MQDQLNHICIRWKANCASSWRRNKIRGEIRNQTKNNISDEVPPVLPVGGEVSKAALFPIPDSIFLVYSHKERNQFLQFSRNLYGCYNACHLMSSRFPCCIFSYLCLWYLSWNTDKCKYQWMKIRVSWVMSRAIYYLMSSFHALVEHVWLSYRRAQYVVVGSLKSHLWS